ncbi:MAG: zinc ribbon domain-containing protein [Ruminococcaceae bacterium]|nr:zinc ribbon domain-containing protein [Oscillospiraceae bacterium]
MAANNRDVRIFPGRPDYYIQKLRNIAYSGMGFTFDSENNYSNAIVFNFRHGVSFTSWGEQIRVTLTPQGDNTVIDVYSECSLPTQVVDWGKNKENTSRIIMYLSNNQQGYAQQAYAQPQQGYAQPQQGYARPQQGYAQPQQGYAQPQQTYAQQQQTGTQQFSERRFCSSCGESINPSDEFCSNCGQKVK